MPLTGSQIDAIEAFKIPAPIEKAESVVELKEEEKEEEVSYKKRRCCFSLRVLQKLKICINQSCIKTPV